MAYVVLNGLTVKIARSQVPRVKRRTRGRDRVGITGDHTEARRASKWGPWECVTPPMSPDEAESLENLLLGKAHVWDLVGNVASSGGAGIRSSTTALAQFKFAGGPYSDTANYLLASAGTQDFVCGLSGSRWTAMINAKPSGEVAYEWYAFRSAGNYFRSGVLQGATTLPWFSRQSNGDGRFLGENNAAAFAALPIAAIVAMPWLVPDAQLASLTTWLTRRWGPSPLIDISGTFLPPTALFARGAVTASTHSRGQDATAYKDNRRAVAFTLMEA